MHGNIIFQPDTYMTGNVFTPYASKVVVTPDSDYSTGIQDRVIMISTTIAGARTILLNDFDEFIFQLTIIMTAQSVGTYSAISTLQGDISFAAANRAETFIHLGNGEWSLLKS
jgi:hypothetical protein